MLMSSLMVFDEYVRGTATMYTSDEHISALGQYDLLALQAVIDEPSSATAINIQILHSADARNFAAKNSLPEINGAIPDQAPGHGGILGAGNTTVLTGADGSNLPSLAFIRLQLNLIGATPKAHVRIYVTSREQGGGGGTGGLFLGTGATLKPMLSKIGG